MESVLLSHNIAEDDVCTIITQLHALLIKQEVAVDDRHFGGGSGKKIAPVEPFTIFIRQNKVDEPSGR